MKKILFLFLLSLVPSITLAATFDHNLKYGMTGIEVQTLQKFLNMASFTVTKTGGGSPGNETLEFGPATRTALASFQRSQDIAPAVGYFGPQTRARVNMTLDAHPDWTVALSNKSDAEGTGNATVSPESLPQGTKSVIDMKIDRLRDELLAKINRISGESQNNYAANSSAIALTNRINQLTNTAINTPTITGGSLTGTSISGGSITGATISGTTLTVSSGVFSGNLTVSGTATSTFAGDSAFNTNTLYVDSLNNRVGVATSSPFTLFSVGGQVAGSYFTATANTASVFPYASSTALTVSGNAYLGTVVSPTLSGTVTNSGTISGGTVNSHITQHCTTITDYNGTPTTLLNKTTGSFPAGDYTKMNLDTILVDPDGAADLANSQIIVPSWAGHVQVFGHIDFPAQTNGNGYASMHLFRNNTPTIEDTFDHTRVYYPATTTSVGYVTAYGASPVVRVLGANETWQLYAWQDSGGSISLGSPGTWLQVCFYP